MHSIFCRSLTTIVIISLFTVNALSKEKNITSRAEMPCFIQNVGQIIDTNQVPLKQIDYQLCANGVVVFVSNGMLQYQWYRQKALLPIDSLKTLSGHNPADIYAMQVSLVGANKNAIAVADGQQTYYENYYLSYCNGKTAHSYNKITYKDIYPNIDWVLYTNSTGEVKYDFVVRAGGDVSAIRLQYKGASSLKLQDGAIEVTTPFGNVTEQKPYSYDMVTKRELQSRYILKGDEVHFEVEECAHSIVIDPALYWATYFSDHYTIGTCTAADTLGNSYLCGYTANLTTIASSTANQSTYGGGVVDGFISKYNIDGTKLWSTYYGGAGIDEVLAAATNLTGDIFVTGITTSTTQISGGTNPQKTTFTGPSGSTQNDAFLARFSASGNLTWGTYMGGVGSDAGASVVCDKYGSVYVGGTTSDTTSDTTGHFYKGYQSTPGSGFFARYNTSDGHRIWGSFFNGDVKALTLDNRGNLFIGGITSFYTGVGYGNTYKPSYTASLSNANGFVCRFNALSGDISWGSYYGASATTILSLACDSFGSVYAGGNTTDASTMATPGAHLTTASSGFLAELDSSGKRVWGTYYPVGISSVLSSTDHKIYVAGGFLLPVGTTPPAGLASGNAYQSAPGGGFMGKFDLSGKRIWGTFVRGDSLAYITIAYGGRYGGIDGGNRLFIGGFQSDRQGKIPTANAYQPTYIGEIGSFIAQYYTDTSVYIKFPYVDTILCAGGPLHVNYGVTNLFRPGNVFTIQLSDASGSFASAVNVGILAYNDRKDINCTIPVSTPQGVGYKVRIVSSAPADTFYNFDMPIRISAYPHPNAIAIEPICANLNLTMTDSNAHEPVGTEYTWLSPNPGRLPGLFTPNVVNSITLADSGDYILIANNHTCIGRDTVHVHVNVAPPEPTITGDTSLCIGDTLRLMASSPLSGVTFGWFKPDNSFAGYIPGIELPGIMLSDSGKYRVSGELYGCQSSPFYGQVVTVHPLPLPSASSNSPLCTKETLKLTSSDTAQNVSYSWAGPQNFASLSKDTDYDNIPVTGSGIYVVKTTTTFGCSNTDSITVVVKPLPNELNASANSPLCEGDTLHLNSNVTTGASYRWSGPNNFSSSANNAVIAGVALDQSGTYKIVADLDGCTREDTTSVVVAQIPPKPVLSSNSPLYTGGILKLNISNAQSGVNYSWVGPRGFSTPIVNPALNSILPNMSGVYIAIATNGICTSSDSITVEITDEPGITPDKPFVIFPNPNNGTFKIKGETKTDEEIELVVFASDGKEVYRASFTPINKQVDQVITITGLASGVYRLKLDVDNKRRITLSFTIKN